MELTPGTRLGPYEILGPLDAGGMGQVLHARDVNLDRRVAIKVLRDATADDPAWVARFDREARLLAALTHPNIATVYGLDEVGGLRYIAMELVPGQTLARRLDLSTAGYTLLANLRPDDRGPVGCFHLVSGGLPGES